MHFKKFKIGCEEECQLFIKRYGKDLSRKQKKKTLLESMTKLFLKLDRFTNMNKYVVTYESGLTSSNSEIFSLSFRISSSFSASRRRTLISSSWNLKLKYLKKISKNLKINIKIHVSKKNLKLIKRPIPNVSHLSITTNILRSHFVWSKNNKKK